MILDSTELATWFVSFWFAIWVELKSHSICFFDGLVPALNIGFYLVEIIVVSSQIEILKSVVSSCRHQEFLSLLLE